MFRFSAWLVEQPLHHHHVELLLCGRRTAPLCIKCDLVEPILDPLRIPQGSRLAIQLDCLKMQFVAEKNTKVPIYQLSSWRMVEAEKISDLVICGQPFVLVATKSVSLNQQEIGDNSNRFAALVQLMREKKAAMIVTQKSKHHNASGYFVLLPPKGDKNSSSLLVKQLASKDTLMPVASELAADGGDSDRDRDSEMVVELSKLSVESQFNPLFYGSNLL